MSTNGGDWKTPAFRQRVIFNIDEAIKKSPGTERRSAQEIEQCIFEKATSRETYMTIVARTILALTAVSQNKGQPIQPTNAGAIMDPNVQPSSMVNPDALRSDTTHILPMILVQPSPINSVSTPSPKILRSPSPAAAQPGSGKKQLKIEELNVNVYQDLCRKLNIPSPGRDYKTLAGKLGYNTEELKEFEQEKNPAGAVLSHWGTKFGNPVNKLIGILKRMGNDAVAEKLKRALELSRRSQGEQDLMEIDHTLPSTEEESNGFVLIGTKRSHESDQYQTEAEPSSKKEDETVSTGIKRSHESNQSPAEGEPSSKKKDETVAPEIKDKASDTDKKPFFVQDLDSNLKSKVCQLLNKKSVLKRDFRGLAVKMKFENSEIELFEQCDNSTDALLQEWGTRREATVENLIKILEKMKRDDVVDILKEAQALVPTKRT